MSYGFSNDQVGFLKLGKSYRLTHKELDDQAGKIVGLPSGPIIHGLGDPNVRVEYKLNDETIALFCGYFTRELPGGWTLTDEEWS